MPFADLLAGTTHRPLPMPAARPTILVFDSGLGGLTVWAEIARRRPDARIPYAADDAGFPYGALSERELVDRCGLVLGRLIDRHRPDLCVIACNTASTLVLPHLRARFDLPFVGTVPAVKPAAQASRTGRIAVLATPGTVARDYTRGLVEAYAGACRVDLVGAKHLAEYAEAEMSGRPVPDAAIADEIGPCFVDAAGRRTDVVVLACTHYPLLRARFERLAPWPVAWIDPAPAIARRVDAILGPALRPNETVEPGMHRAVFTDGSGLTPALRAALAIRGFAPPAIDRIPRAPVRAS